MRALRAAARWQALALAGLLPALAAAAPAELTTCADSNAQVMASLEADRRDACAGAAAAIGFFQGLGREAIEPPVMEVTPVLPTAAGPTAAGCFMPDRKRVYLLTYERFRQQRNWFGVSIGRSLYRSLATHEAAHALAACHFKLPKPSIQATEYLAYVAMFSTMEPALRARILRANPGSGFQSADRITPLFYMFDPMRFGVESYRHYLRPDAGPPFAASVLEGAALRDE